MLGSILGLIFATFGTFAPGAYLATSRAGRLGLVVMDITVLGSALFLPGMGVSAFSAPEEWQAYLASIEEFESPRFYYAVAAAHTAMGADLRRS